MKLYISIISIFTFFASNSITAQNNFLLNRFSETISFIRMDSLHTSQATIIEYPEFLTVIELPFIDEGGNVSKNLHEDSTKAEEFIRFLDKIYKGKPVKHILHSHWHLHSLSGITPFFKRNATLYTAKSNWQYSINNGFLANTDINAFSKQISFVEKDTTILSKTEFPISILHLDISYRFKPTKEYLLFYFPQNKALHASCLCAVSETELQRKGGIYHDRLTDIRKAVESRSLEVDTIIKLGRYDQKKGTYLPPYFLYSSICTLMDNAKPYFSLIKQIADIDSVILLDKKDSLLTATIAKKTSPSLFNQAVYECIRVGEYNKAIILAHFLNLYYPGEVAYIDTMGEAYYVAGDIEAATYYDSLLKRKDPKFTGGLETWAQNKKEKGH